MLFLAARLIVQGAGVAYVGRHGAKISVHTYNIQFSCYFLFLL